MKIQIPLQNKFNKQLMYHAIGILVLVVMLCAVTLPTLYYIRYKNGALLDSSQIKLYSYEQFELDLAEAGEFLERGLYDNAIILLRESARNSLKRYFAAEALTRIADLLYSSEEIQNQDRYVQALEFYGVAMSFSEDQQARIWKSFQIANCHFKTSSIDSAIALYKDFINKYPDSEYCVDAQLNLASLYLKRNKFSLARETLQVVLNTAVSEKQFSLAVFQLANSFMQESEKETIIYQ
ncbi:MAG: outer membrane protein assembly factor BamD [Candidatus Auribacter fodinae]|uniref:Outer membrane protein assembly factor BamD n=1 Tax=Candidatus Auribacter fodinae TaxID=2093366 RepID=A0A3A4R4W3_9BACT|nr:MAG: outer membrane protein assembly factor BamD [Candidatus Auribacter fodinae]